MYANSTDQHLLRAWQMHQDAEAFHTIVQRHAGLVYNTCRHILRNDADAADVSQECFLRLANTPPDIEHSLAGWLHRLATHRSLDFLKQAKRRRNREIRYATQPLPATNVPDTDLLGAVDEAIDALSDELRLPVVDHFLRQKTHQEIAENLGLTRRATTYRIQRGIKHVRENLKRRGIAAPASALLAALEAEGTPLPPSIHAKLGKHALAGGVRTGAVPSLAIPLAAGLLMKKGWIAAAGIVALLAAWLLLAPSSPPPRDTTAPAPQVAHDDESPEPETLRATNLKETTASAVPSETATSASESSSTFQISGRVFDAHINAPIANAEVVVALAQAPQNVLESRTTDRSGNYALPPLPPGHYTVYRNATPGYPSTTRFGVGKSSLLSNKIDGTHVNLAADTTVDFPVLKGLTVSGHVLDKRERGVPGATVSASAFGNPHAQSTTTDETGHFLLAGFQATPNLHLRATKGNYGEIILTNQLLAAPGLNGLKLHLSNPASIRGTVVNADGEPLPRARVIAVHFQHYGAWSFDYPKGASDENGKFHISDLHPGRYKLQVFPEAYVNYFDPAPTSVSVTEGEDLRNIKLVLDNGEGLDVAGRVTDPENNPLADVIVNVFGPRERSVKTSEDGSFHVSGLIEGSYQVYPYKPGYRLPSDDDFAFGPSLHESKLDYHLVLQKNDLRVQGVVLDDQTGRPLPGAQVVANLTSGTPHIDRGDWLHSNRFDNPDGSFDVAVRGPWRMENGRDITQCAVIARKDGYAPAITTVEIEGTATPFVEVRLRPGRTISGTVSTGNGTPVHGAVIAEGEVTDPTRGLIPLGTSDEHGDFEVVGFRDGIHTLSAVHPAHPVSHASIGDTTGPVRIVFPPSGEVQGTVRIDGQSMPLVAVYIESRGTGSSFSEYGATNQTGEYHFGALAPGAYDVTVRQTVGMSISAMIQRHVIIQASETMVIDFDLVSGTTLTGTVAINGVAPSKGRIRYQVITDSDAAKHERELRADGSWVIEDVTPGPGTVEIQATDSFGRQYDRQIAIDLAPGEQQTLDLDLANESETPAE